MGKYQKDNEEKFHAMVPRQFVDKVRNLKGKQVKVTMRMSYRNDYGSIRP